MVIHPMKNSLMNEEIILVLMCNSTVKIESEKIATSVASLFSSLA